METEFKYRLDDTSVFDSIVETAASGKMGLEAVETIDMHAAYFDTEDYDFRKRGSLTGSVRKMTDVLSLSNGTLTSRKDCTDARNSTLLSMMSVLHLIQI